MSSKYSNFSYNELRSMILGLANRMIYIAECGTTPHPADKIANTRLQQEIKQELELREKAKGIKPFNFIEEK